MQKNKSNHVGDHHDTVKEVRKGPDEINVRNGSQNQESTDDYTIEENASTVKEVADILFAEEIPGNNR